MELNAKSLAQIFFNENRPLTLEFLQLKTKNRKPDIILDILIILQYQKIVSKISFASADFYVLTCPFYGTPYFSLHTKTWKLELAYNQLLDEITSLDQINTDLNQEIHDKGLN